MPKFTGKRQTRWYQAQATLRAIEHIAATGQVPHTSWTTAKILRMTHDITAQAFTENDLDKAANALEFYLQRELAEDAISHLPPILAWIAKAWRFGQ